MSRLYAVIFMVGAMAFSACAHNDGNGGSDDSKSDLGGVCEIDNDCRRGVCDNRVCAMENQACDAEADCLSWEFCDQGTCEDECALMGVCTDGHVCERGACVPAQGCQPGDEDCVPCDDLSDCGDYEICEAGVCVSNGDCEPWFTGWFINAAGECEEGGKSGCDNPFPFESEGACVAAIDNTLSSCPDDSNLFFGDDRPIAGKALRCEYGQECCCGECYPSLVCFADAPGDTFVCFATDACMIPGCACEEDADCGSDEVCEDNFCRASCALVDCQEGYICERGQCRPPDSCTAYWEGAELVDGACVAQSASGCSNPFTYESVAACCEANEDVDGCGTDACESDADCATSKACDEGKCVEACAAVDCVPGYACIHGTCEPSESCEYFDDCSSNQHYCEEGVCVFNGFCDGYWSGAFLNENGECREGGISGCDNPFPYASMDACCEANPAACGSDSGERACVNAGGDWELFPNTCADNCGTEGQGCGQAFTWGCDCGPDACWDGESCSGTSEGCKEDSDCGEGEVCEQGLGGENVCVTGCRDDADCESGEFCNDKIVCVTSPCPYLCERAPNCGDLTCDPGSEYCMVGYPGVRPVEGEGTGISYSCNDLSADCVDARAKCQCLESEESLPGDCSEGADGLVTFSVYYP